MGSHYTIMNFQKLLSAGHRFQACRSLSSVSRPSTHHSEPPKLEKTLNSVTLLGRVGGEPQKRGTEEHPVVIFSLATHANYKYDSGDFVQRTEWHRVCVFKPNLRDTVYNFMKKGQRVYVQGRITYGEIKDENGVARPTTAVVADDVIFFQSGEHTS